MKLFKVYYKVNGFKNYVYINANDIDDALDLLIDCLDNAGELEIDYHYEIETLNVIRSQRMKGH